MLAKRLQNHALGKLDLTSTQLKAIEILLKKTLPDLSSIDATIKGDEGAPIAFTLLPSDIPPHPKAD
jgi:hypothetical protein